MLFLLWVGRVGVELLGWPLPLASLPWKHWDHPGQQWGASTESLPASCGEAHDVSMATLLQKQWLHVLKAEKHIHQFIFVYTCIYLCMYVIKLKLSWILMKVCRQYLMQWKMVSTKLLHVQGNQFRKKLWKIKWHYIYIKLHSNFIFLDNRVQRKIFKISKDLRFRDQNTFNLK